MEDKEYKEAFEAANRLRQKYKPCDGRPGRDEVVRLLHGFYNFSQVSLNFHRRLHNCILYGFFFVRSESWMKGRRFNFEACLTEPGRLDYVLTAACRWSPYFFTFDNLMEFMRRFYMTVFTEEDKAIMLRLYNIELKRWLTYLRVKSIWSIPIEEVFSAFLKGKHLDAVKTLLRSSNFHFQSVGDSSVSAEIDVAETEDDSETEDDYRNLSNSRENIVTGFENNLRNNTEGKVSRTIEDDTNSNNTCNMRLSIKDNESEEGAKPTYDQLLHKIERLTAIFIDLQSKVIALDDKNDRLHSKISGLLGKISRLSKSMPIVVSKAQENTKSNDDSVILPVANKPGVNEVLVDNPTELKGPNLK